MLPLSRLAQLPDPPPDLEPDTFAGRLYDALLPLAQHDPEAGWSLLIFVNAIGTMYEMVEDLVRDTPDGPGWSPLMDLERCPDEALGWLAQFVGVRLLPGHTPDQDRQRIASTDGFHRGTPAAMRGAAQATLLPPATVVFRERYGDPYFLDVYTFDDETPDPALTERALIAQKPGGIVMTYRHMDGQDYQLVKDTHATYAAAKAAYPTYAQMKLGPA